MNDAQKDDESWPRSVDDAVDRLLSELPDGSLLHVRAMPRDELIGLYRGLGMWIRNNMGLWAGNEALLADCPRFAREHDVASGNWGDPEGSSMVILEALWLRLQEPVSGAIAGRFDPSWQPRQQRLWPPEHERP